MSNEDFKIAKDIQLSQTDTLSETVSAGTEPLSFDHIGDKTEKVVQGRIRLQSVLGSGGMSTVYKATHLLLDQPVAYKVLNPGLCSDKAIVRFQQEGKAATRLSHPYIATVREFGQDETGAPYLVMDYVDGMPLSNLLAAENKIDVARAVRLIAQVCEGLQHAHERGVVHRDIKPSNIMIVGNEGSLEQVRIVDFGIAKVITSEGSNLTQTGEVFGTPNYMSPEQCQGQHLDARTDVYSLGCVLYEAVTGRKIVTADNPLHALMQHVNGIVPDFNKSAISPSLQSVILKALERDPKRRFQSMDEFRQALCTAGLSPTSEWKKNIRNKSTVAWRRLNWNVVILCSLLCLSVYTVVHRLQIDSKFKVLSHDAAVDKKRVDKELRLLEQLKTNRSDPSTLITIGAGLEELGKYDLAEKAYRRALKLQPDNQETWLKLSRILTKENNPAGAAEALRHAHSN